MGGRPTLKGAYHAEYAYCFGCNGNGFCFLISSLPCIGERFETPHLPQLPFETSLEVEKKLEEKFTQQISYLRKKPSTHQGRLPLPDHLPVEEIEIHTQDDLIDKVCMGKEIRSCLHRFDNLFKSSIE